jgi:tetratricopeptide (TPR) repeat protein
MKGNKRDRLTGDFVKPEESIDLASALYGDGQTEKSLAVLTEASQRPWPPAQRGILLNQLAHFHFNVTGKHDEALAFAYEAISALSAQSTNTKSDVALIDAKSLVAHSLWDTDRLRASEAASDALSRIEHLTVAHAGDQDTLWELYYAASRLQALSGQWEKAIESAHRALALVVEEDQRMFPLDELGCILRAAGRNADARGVLTEALRWRTAHGSLPNPRIHHELALVERALGNREEARTQIERAIEIVRNDVYMRSDLRYWKSLHYEVCEILRELGELSKEAQVYRDLIGDLREDDEDIWTIRLLLAGCETELLHFEAAREVLDVIQRSAPSPELRETAGKETINLLYRIALRDYEIGRYETSIKESEAVLALCEGNPELRADLLIMLGNGHAMLKKYAQARMFYEEVVASLSARRDQRYQAEESIRRLPPHVKMLSKESIM